MTLKEAKDRYGQLATAVEQMKNVVDSEKRKPTDEERKSSVEMLTEMDGLEIEIDNLEFQERMDQSLQKAKESRQRIVKPSPINISSEKKGFRSMGEMLQAVYMAGTSPKVDPRLEYRAATGMNETIPADGGLA